jgi:hypothetical protein
MASNSKPLVVQASCSCVLPGLVGLVWLCTRREPEAPSAEAKLARLSAVPMPEYHEPALAAIAPPKRLGYHDWVSL